MEEPQRQTPRTVSEPLPAAAAETDATFEEEEQDFMPRIFKRLDRRLAEELSAELMVLPEINLETARGTAERLVSTASLRRHESRHLTLEVFSLRADLAGLPFRKGADCELGSAPAAKLQNLSERLRTYLTEPQLPVDEIRMRLNGRGDAEDVPALVQVLQAQDAPMRMLLVELLRRIEHRSASHALAQRAVFDLDAQVREAAANALNARPLDEYQAFLIQSLRYPWPPVADHAAEALAYLAERSIAGQLVALLELPDPAAPTMSRDSSRTAVVHEVVRVNHLRNCLMCHAVSLADNDKVRGRVPNMERRVPEPTPEPAYYRATGSNDIFVRADTTYLKQDFSVVQQAKSPGNGPSHQRHDYLVRARPAPFSKPEAAWTPGTTYPQRESVLFALRELTGKNAGNNAASWREALGLR
jgi:hypothetical protein